MYYYSAFGILTSSLLLCFSISFLASGFFFCFGTTSSFALRSSSSFAFYQFPYERLLLLPSYQFPYEQPLLLPSISFLTSSLFFGLRATLLWLCEQPLLCFSISLFFSFTFSLFFGFAGNLFSSFSIGFFFIFACFFFL